MGYWDLPCVDMGLNTDPSDGQLWTEKVAEFKALVEEHGAARASWSCTGRTRHQMHASQLALACPEYDFEIDYDSYRCVGRKRK